LRPSLSLAKPEYVLPLVLVSGALVRLAAFWHGVRRARALAAQGQRFERRLAVTGRAVLILGDSTGVGVGASRPEESIAGLLAADFPDAHVVNISESGARVCDAVEQAKKLDGLERRFDVAVLHLGGNDVVRNTPLPALAEACEALLAELPRLAQRTVWLGPPNIGLAPLFPLPYAWVLAARSKAVAALIAQSAARHGVAFVDFSAREHAERFARKRRQHFATDGFHPNSSSYSYGYAAARQAMGLDATSIAPR
jgi:lysophospholipase L1-like esterase